MVTLTRRAAILLGITLWSSMLSARSLDFVTRELPWAVVGNAYDEKIETSIDGRCPRGDVGLELFGGALPRGVEMVGDRLVGAPRSMGIFPIMIRAANSCSFEVKGFQIVVTAEPALRAVPDELRFEFRTGCAKPAPQSVLVFSTWPSVLYSVQADDPWLSFSHAGITPELGSELLADVVAVRVKTENLKPGVYRSTLRLSTPRFASAPTVQVTLTVVP